MAGGWASALGAAILGGNQGYQQGLQNQQQRQLTALQLKLVQDQVDELRKQHARGDLKDILDREGPEAFNNPAAVEAANVAGVPMQRGNLGAAAQQLPGGSVLSNEEVGRRTGIAPNTGVQIPQQFQQQAALKALQLEQARQGMVIGQRLADVLTPSQPGAPSPQASPDNEPPASLTPGGPTSEPTSGPAASVPSGPGALPTWAPPALSTPDDPTFPNGTKRYVAKLHDTYQGDGNGMRLEMMHATPDLLSAHPNLDMKKFAAALPPLGPYATAPGPPAVDTATLPKLPPKYTQEDIAKHAAGKHFGYDIPLTENADYTLALERQKKIDAATFKVPGQKLEQEGEAYKKAADLIPLVREALMNEVRDKNDPHGQKASYLEMLPQLAKSKAKKTAYDLGLPLSDNDSKAQQLAGQLKVIAASPYMTNSRNMKMFDEIAVHLGDRSATPEAQLQKLDELAQIFPQFAQELGYKPGQQNLAPAAGRPAIKADAGSLPQAKPAPTQKTISNAEINAMAKAKHITNVNQFKQQLASEGWTGFQ